MSKEEIREMLLKLYPGESLFLNALVDENNFIYIYHFVLSKTKVGDVRRVIPNADEDVIKKIEQREKEKKDFCKKLEEQLISTHGTLCMSL